MKKINILVFLFCILCIAENTQAQFPCVRNISTNPNNPFNTEWGAMFWAKEVAETGLALGETQAQLTRLVEELTLRLLQMEERIEELELELAK